MKGCNWGTTKQKRVLGWGLGKGRRASMPSPGMLFSQPLQVSTNLEALQPLSFQSFSKASSLGFPDGSEVKNLSAKAGDTSSIPGPGRSLGEGNGNPLQCCCLENPMEPGVPQSMGLQRVRHDIGTEEQQHKASLPRHNWLNHWPLVI